MPELVHAPGAFGAILLATAILFPMFVGFLGLFRSAAGWALKVAPVAALPALALSVGTPAMIELPGFMLGSRFATGGTVSVWLFVTSVLWFAAAWFGAYYLAHDERRGLYVFFFSGSMAGNFGLIMAGDPVLFLAFFALMSFMSYGLVVHDREPESMRAGRVYLAMAVLGEMLQYAGLSLVAFPIIGKGDPLILSFDMLVRAEPMATVLFVGGFGVKAGLLGLHMWLPMAHPVAPTSASAVLSGSMIKAGLIGWINFLPLGIAAMDGIGTAMAALGLTGALAAALIGSVQRQAKAVLAYSSVSQMGLIATVFGVGLARLDAWDAMLWVVIVYAAHHALAKCMLFLSVGIKTTRPVGRLEAWVFWGGTGIAALALSGAPATSGMAAKLVLADAVEAAAPVHVDLVLALLTVAAVGTTLLMARFLDLVGKLRHDEVHTTSRVIYAPWLLLLSLVCVFAWHLAVGRFPASVAVWKKTEYWMKGLWPVVIGVVLYLAGKRIGRLLPGEWHVPPGDIYFALWRISTCMSRCVAVAGGRISAVLAALTNAGLVRLRLAAKRVANGMGRAESSLAVWRFGGAAVLVAGASFFWLAFG